MKEIDEIRRGDGPPLAGQKRRTVPQALDALHTELDMIVNQLDDLEALCSPLTRCEPVAAFDSKDSTVGGDSPVQQGITVLWTRLKHLQYRISTFRNALDL